MATHKLAILVEAIGAAKASSQLKGIDKTISNIGARGGKGIRTAADNLQRLGVAASGLAIAGLAGAVKVAADFESGLNTINTVAQLSSEALAQVGQDIRKLARDSGSDLNDLTSAYYDLVSAGIKPGTDAIRVLTLANTLAIGGLATTAETVDLLTSAINTYGLNAAGAAKATDMFAEAIALGKVTAAEIAGSFAIVAPLAQKAGIGIDEISAAYGHLTARGVPAAEAATQMRSAIVGLMKPTAALNKAQKTLGVNFAQIAKRKGLAVAMQQIVDYSKKTGVPLMKLLGRIEGVNYALSVTGSSADDYNKALQSVRKATGVAAEQMSERQQGLNYELNRLKALAKDAAITIGNKLLPKLTPLAEKAVAFLETHQGDIDKFGNTIASAFDKAAAFAAKIPWDTIGAGLKVSAEWAGKLMDVFLSMPKEVQTTLIALAGLNKLSGGAIGGIVGELGKGLVKGVLGMTAGVVNLRAGVVNGGGLGGAASAGGGMGKLGKLALAGEAIAGIAAVIATQQEVSAQNSAIASDIHASLTSGIKTKTPQELITALNGVNQGINDIQANPLNVLVAGDALDQLRGMRSEISAALGNSGTGSNFATHGGDKWKPDSLAKEINPKITDLHHGAVQAIDASGKAAASATDKAKQDIGSKVTMGAQGVAQRVTSGTSGTTAATNVGSSRIVGAIAANRPIVTTTVKVYVTPAGVTKSTNTAESYGNTTGSGGSGNNGANKVD